MNFQDFLFQTYQQQAQRSRWQGNLRISSLCSHSSEVKKDSLFLALEGRESDGHQYLESAIQKGASALLVKEGTWLPPDFKGLVLIYKKEELFLSQLLNQFYDFPSDKLFTVGITGTNGKTSFCYLLQHFFEACGWPTALMGTLGHKFGDKTWPSVLTTPSACELFERLSDFVRLEARALTMELSSIAIDQKRMEGVGFNALVFSNLSQDHLDYHQSMENYFLAKQKLFLSAEKSSQKNLFYLLNHDDIYSHKIKTILKKPSWTFGKSQQADFKFQIKKACKEKTLFELQTPSAKTEFSSPLKGEHNVYNVVSAIACAFLTGFKLEDCQKALYDFKGIPGRLERLKSQQDFEVFIDYAHTTQALSFALKTLKKESSDLSVVFGCGGDRDTQKRSPMMRVALDLADKIFLTTDNPRNEDPEKIIQDMLQGVSKEQREAKVIEELDRSEAIKKALTSAQKGTCVLIAGKGHEAFQIIKGKKYPFSDKQVALKILNS